MATPLPAARSTPCQQRGRGSRSKRQRVSFVVTQKCRGHTPRPVVSLYGACYRTAPTFLGTSYLELELELTLLWFTAGKGLTSPWRTQDSCVSFDYRCNTGFLLHCQKRPAAVSRTQPPREYGRKPRHHSHPRNPQTTQPQSCHCSLQNEPLLSHTKRRSQGQYR